MQEYHGPAITPGCWRFDAVCFVDDHVGSGDSKSWQWFTQMLDHAHDTVLVEYISCDLPRTRCLPLQTFYTAWTLAQCVPERTWLPKVAAFNFSVNKQTPGRDAMVKHLDCLGISTVHYTKSWSDNSQHTQKVWLWPGQQHEGALRNGSRGNVAIFEAHLRQHVYEPTVFSVITEPVWDQPAAFISEKTVFALEAGTIPIWCGGWGIPATMSELGFDVFADIVDHSYQHEPNALDRVRLALDLNQDLLRDSAGALALSATVRSRLEHNQRRMRSCDWFYGMVTSATREMTPQQVHDVYKDLIIKRNYELPNSCQVRGLVSGSV